MERVGKEGVITVNDGKTLENELEVVEGMKFDRGFISPYFVTDAKMQTFEVENPYILLAGSYASSATRPWTFRTPPSRFRRISNLSLLCIRGERKLL
jgi:hypothetical protein